MTKRRWLASLATSILLTAGAITAPAAGATHEDDVDDGADVAISGSALERASAAALDYLGEGRITDTEVGDEEGFYEVEVTLPDGTQVDVHLDEDFTVLGEETDGAEDDEE